LSELQRVTLDCYALAIASAAQYAVEVDPAETAQFRERLRSLEKLLQTPPNPGAVQAVGASFRGELREYRDQAQERIARLRREMLSAAEAMKVFADGVATNGAGHEKELEEELHDLTILARSEDLRKIREGIQAATQGLAASFDKMRRGNQLVIAQLQDEIRLLHQEMQAERRSLLTDSASGAWNRQKISGRMDELLRLDEPFCLLLIRIRNLKQLDIRHSRNALEGALKAVFKRLQSMTGEEATIGRWSEEEFAIILPIEPPDAMALSREAARKLSGDYTVQENGLAKSVAFQVTAGIDDRRAGADPAKFLHKVEQLSEALAQT
jgi:GGDEF domain-containing protein